MGTWERRKDRPKKNILEIESEEGNVKIPVKFIQRLEIEEDNDSEEDDDWLNNEKYIWNIQEEKKEEKEIKFKTGTLTKEQKEKFERLIKSNLDIFAKNKKDLGKTTKVKHTIDTGSEKPIKQRFRRFSHKEKETIRKEIDTMLENGIIRKSKSPWASPIVLVKKKDGSTRFCIDFRKLNKITKKDNHPLPRIDDMLDKFQGSQWFSSIDLASGY